MGLIGQYIFYNGIGKRMLLYILIRSVRTSTAVLYATDIVPPRMSTGLSH